MLTQVAIVGAGPAGLLLGRLLDLAGIDNVIIERQTPEYVAGRIRAGVLEQATVNVLQRAGVAQRLHAEGLVHHGVELAFADRRLRVDFEALVGGSTTVYGQTEVTRDLMDARESRGSLSFYSASDVAITDIDGPAPVVRFADAAGAHELRCAFIAGCDGFHGVCRASVPPSAIRNFERIYPFGWLGVLVDQPPVADELIYASHDRGFALCSMRSRSRSRYYIQCGSGEKAEDWSDERFFDELSRRLDPQIAAAIAVGPSIEKSIAPLRSFVCEPVRFGRLFLAGDAAHIVPPTGAKGLNLAVRDVADLADALIAHLKEGSSEGIDSYSAKVVDRTWKSQRFCWWMTSLLHHFPDSDDFESKLRSAEFDNLASSTEARRAFAANYTGMAQ